MPAKSVKQTSEAMARARKSLRQFSGELAAPILVKEPGPGRLSATFLERKIAERRSAKLSLLLAHYHIAPNDKNRWIKLSGCLAADFVPGMIAVKLPPEKKSPPRKNKEWTFEQYSNLVRDVDEVRAKSRLRRIRWAIQQLVRQNPQKWGTYNKGSLKTRYHEGKRKVSELDKWISLRPLGPRWAPEGHDDRK